ncbi:gliding motility protein RemB [Rubrolithibacter danxiaensis]|uniref:gliding motility protein RemB n=1 Tax=Rubrolithibacter danxiaensis TaxID=3390805 RepID=UPI003BF81183
MNFRTLRFLPVFLIFAITAHAQTPSQVFPYSYQFYQKLDADVYNKNTRFHSALRPYFLDDSVIARKADSILNYGVDTSRKGWVMRTLFNKHLIDVKKEDYTAYVDFLPDFQIGTDSYNNKNTWINTRGFQAGGTVGKKFSFYTSAFENQAEFARYYQEYVDSTHVVFGQATDRKPKGKVKDWSYVTAVVSYTPNKYLNVSIGQEKTFIGDGYRSMLLSDFASNYPFLRLTANLGNVQYMAMWAAMQDPGSPQFSYDSGYRKKGGVFHYLDWNVNNRLSLGFFDAIIWAQKDSLGNRRGFDLSYANPIIFLRPLEFTSGSPDNAAIGLTAKYELFNKTAIYGQFFLDEFEAKSLFGGTGSYRNKWGLQLGLRGADLFKVERLNYLFEFNTATPYTYTSRARIINYANYNEPLAHSMGANFREVLGILNYSYRRFGFQGQFNFALYGMDTEPTDHYGKNIFKPYTDATIRTGNFIGEGLKTDFSYAQGTVSYLLNPKYNLRIELGGILRAETNSLRENKTSWITFGLRSSFRSIYQDF